MKISRFKGLIRSIVSKSPRLYVTQLYLKKWHKLPNFKNPTDLSEILFSEVLNHELGKYAPYADKVEVRQYIEQWGLGEYLPKLYGVWNAVDDITIDNLPEKFALKTNHGCGNHIFCRDKSMFNLAETKEKMRPVLLQSYGSLLEPHYRLIHPKVFAEEFLEQKGSLLPTDYKFMCCDGKVKFIVVAAGRGSEKGTKLLAYDKEWNKLDYIIGPEKTDENIPSPSQEVLKKMIEIAEQIAEHFVHVRVDLYDIDGRIVIGELTFTPEAGVMSYFNYDAVLAAGHGC